MALRLLSEFLDHFGLNVSYLNEDLGLIKPILDNSVAGVLPEVIRQMNIDSELTADSSHVRNPNLEKKIAESFPSGYDNVVFFICDGVGAERLQKLGGTLWDNINEQGTIASTMFPSMTSTVMTSLAFGMFPGDHGLLGYNLYNEHLDEVWNSLNLQYKKDDKDTYILENNKLADFVEGKPIMDHLAADLNDLKTTFIAPDQLVSPSLLDLINHTITPSTYTNPIEGGMLLANALSQDVKNQVTAVYVGYADYFGHAKGPESAEYGQAIAGIDQMIGFLLNHPKMKDGSTLGILTSDHGQVQIDHSKSYWQTREEWKIQKDRGINLSTSGRTLHAFTNSEKLDDARALLETYADGMGHIISRDEAMKLSGGSTKYAHRTGGLSLVLADSYLYDIPEVVQFGDAVRMHGQHGSLTEKELFVPVGIFGGQ